MSCHIKDCDLPWRKHAVLEEIRNEPFPEQYLLEFQPNIWYSLI
jgi:hypothetical protein